MLFALIGAVCALLLLAGEQQRGIEPGNEP